MLGSEWLALADAPYRLLHVCLAGGLQVGQAVGGVTGAFVALAVLPECCTR